VEKKEIVINPKAPDEHWVSPSGSDCWCTVGQLKGLIAEVCRSSNEVVRLKAMVELDCTQPGVCPDVCTMCIATKRGPSRIRHDEAVGAEYLELEDGSGIGTHEANLYAHGMKHGRDEFTSLERSYTQRLGEMARLSYIVCTWTLEHGNLDEESPEVKAAAEEIMEYVEAVRP